MSRYAAIGSDGGRAVVWGLGRTPDAAVADARAEALQSDCDPELTHTVDVTHEQSLRILRGVVDVEVLELDVPS